MTSLPLFLGMLFVPPGSTTTVLPAEIVLLSASYSDHPGAKWAGTLSFATQLKAPATCFSYTSLDVQPVLAAGKLTIAQSTRTGGACQVPQLSRGNFNMFILGTGGMTVINSSILGSGAAGILAAYMLRPKWLERISAGAALPLWIDYQDSNTTGKSARLGVGLAWH